MEKNHEKSTITPWSWISLQAHRSLAKDKHSSLTVAVCVHDTNQAIAIGLSLPPAVFESAKQVLIYQKTGDSIVRNLSSKNIRPFGMISQCSEMLP